MATEKGEGPGFGTQHVNKQTSLITTRGLTLRPIAASDAEALYPSFADPQLMTWWSSGPHANVEETRDYITPGPHWPDGRGWVVIADTSDQPVGRVVAIHRRAQVSEIGFLFARQVWGQGIATKAVSALIAHLFENENNRKIIADVDPDNAPSIGLLERLGFQQEGYLREEWETHLGIRDSLLFGLLAGQWRAIAQQ